MIAASALHAHCDTLWSEDMRHGVVLDGRLRIVNPFRAMRQCPGSSPMAAIGSSAEEEEAER
jgi:hypothetical protein